MKTKSAILGTTFVVLLVVLINAPSVIALESQWFPTEGTTCEYSLKWWGEIPTGVVETDHFNLYNNSGYLSTVSTWVVSNKGFQTTGWTLLKNDTTVKIQHRYSEESSTNWKRVSTWFFGDFNVTGKAIRFYHYGNSTVAGSYTNFFSSDVSVPKSGFIPTLSIDFIDYFDNSKGPGSEIYSDTFITSRTETSIIAQWRYDVGSAQSNQTYIADPTGRLQSMGSSYTFLGMTYSDFKSVGHSFTVITTSGIDGFPLPVLTGIVIIGVIFIIAYQRRKYSK